jgi:EAL domain-containing protein (putative c-di-GMP-specific phosphodiesterase class I)
MDLASAHRLKPESVSLEVTESAVMEDPAHARGVLERLHAIGVRLSIDDFGTGYSSLACLKRLPVHELKIDKSFVIGLVRDPNDAAIVRATIDLAHHMGLTVTAEGVEDGAVLQTLRQLGCDRAQGNHISPPLTAPELARWWHRKDLARPAGAGMPLLH